MKLPGPCHSTEQSLSISSGSEFPRRNSITAFVASYLESVARSGRAACIVDGDPQYACSVFFSGEVRERN
jgi:hypothetical protein